MLRQCYSTALRLAKRLRDKLESWGFLTISVFALYLSFVTKRTSWWASPLDWTRHKERTHRQCWRRASLDTWRKKTTGRALNNLKDVNGKRTQVHTLDLKSNQEGNTRSCTLEKDCERPMRLMARWCIYSSSNHTFLTHSLIHWPFHNKPNTRWLRDMLGCPKKTQKRYPSCENIIFYPHVCDIIFISFSFPNCT